MHPRVAPDGSERAWLASLAGATVGLVILAALGPTGLLLPRRTTCLLGTLEGTYTIWTLETPLNKPPGVNVSMWAQQGAYGFTFTSGSLTVGALRPIEASGGGWGDDGPFAGIFAVGIELNWSVYGVRNESQVEVPSDPCTQPYVAEASESPVSSCGGPIVLPLVNNSSDLVEPNVWNGTGISHTNCLSATPGAYLWFDTSFHADGTGADAPVSWDLCGRTGSFPLTLPGVAQVPISVYVPDAGGEIQARGFESWLGNPTGGFPLSEYSAEYSVPGGWLWMLAPVGPTSSRINTTTPGAPLPALLAFTQSPC